MASPLFRRFLFCCCFLQVIYTLTSSSTLPTDEPTVGSSEENATSTTTTEAPPDAPTNLNYIAQTTSLSVTWTSNQTYVYSVAYQSSPVGASGPVTGCQNINVQHCIIEGLSPGSSYMVTVTSKLSADSPSSSSSNRTAITIPAMPDNSCSLSEITNNSMKLTWSPALASVSIFYTVQYGTKLNNQTVTQVSIINLTPGTMYVFEVWATVSESTSTRSRSIQCSNSTDPDTPTITVLNVTETSVDVNSSIGSTNAAANRTLFYSNGTIYSQQVMSSPRLVLAGLKPGCNYTIYLVVQSYDKSKTSNYVNIITVPAMPDTFCSLSEITSNSMKLTWSPALASVSVFYTVQYGTTRLDNQTVTQVSISSLTPGAMYLFEVWATVSESIAVRSRSIQCSNSTELDTTTINVSNVTETSVDVNYLIGSTIATANRTLFYSNGTIYTIYSQQLMSSSRYVLTGLKPGCNYTIYLVVQSYDKSKTSNYATIITVPALPDNICSLSEITSNSMKLTWSPALASVSVFYTVQYDTKQLTNLTAPPASISSLTPGTMYVFEVWATVSDSISTRSRSIQCSNSTELDVTTITVSNVTETSVEVNYLIGSTIATANRTLFYSNGTIYTIYSQQLMSSSRYILTGLKPGCNYTIYLVVQSYDKSKTSNYETRITVPAMPDSICSLSEITSNSMKLTWSLAIASVSVFYTVQYDTRQLTNLTAPPASIINLTPGTMYLFEVWATVSNSISTQSRRIHCSGSTGPGIPSNIVVSNVNTSSMRIDWSTSGTKVVNYVAVNYTCANIQTSQNATTFNSTVLSNLTPGCNYSFCITIYSFDQKASGCSWNVTYPDMPTIIGMDDFTTSSFHVTWQFGLTNSVNNIVLTYCDVARNLECRNVSVHNMSTSVMLTDLASATNYSLVLLMESYGKPVASSPAWAVTRINNEHDSWFGLDVSHGWPFNDEHWPNLTGDCTVDLRNTTSMLLSWSIPEHTVPLTYRVSYPNITLNSSSSSAPNITFDVPEMPYLATDLLPGATYGVFVQALTKDTAKSIDPFTQLESEAITCIYTTEPQPPINLVLEGLNETSVSATWMENSTSIQTSFDVTYYLTSGDIDLRQTSCSSTATSCLITVKSGDLAGSPYTVCVASVSNSVQSALTCKNVKTYPYRPMQLTYNATSESVTVIIWHPSNTATVDQYFTKITSFPGVLPGLNMSKEVSSAGAETEVKFINLVAASNYRVEVTSVIYGECGQPAICGYQSLQPATVNITTIAGSDFIKIICLAVIIPSCVIIILLVIIIVILIRRKKHGDLTDDKHSDDDGPEDNKRKSIFDHLKISGSEKKTTGPNKPVHVENFPHHVQQLEKDSGLLYTEDYEDLKLIGRDQPMSCSELEHNRTKNRYGNIKPFDITRVKLLPVEDEEGADYINASWMPGFNSKREFIATQGPLPCTKDDFWRMIWEYNCRGIVMLTNCIEKGKNKCDYYWPQDTEPVVYGDIQVSITKEELTPLWNIRQLSISMGQQQKNIVHLHYHVWPDMDVPEDPATLLQFVRLVRARLAKRGGPITVHCSAGVGRTGTFIALDTLLHQLDRQDSIDIFGVVYKLRLNRLCMVQTESQYVFLYRSMMYELEHRSNVNMALEEDDVYANFNGGQKKKPEDEMYANFDGGPKKKAEDDTYANFRGAQTNSVAEIDGKFFFAGPQQTS